MASAINSLVAHHGASVLGRARPKREFRAVGLFDFIHTELPEQKPLLEPWLIERSLALVHAYRGVGKTWFGLGVAYAVATGGSFLGWAATAPKRVLYLDGEMPARALQDRLKAMIDSDERDVPDNVLSFVTPDLLDGAPPDLGDKDDQEVLDDLIQQLQPALIVVDNISCLVRSGGGENDAESWIPVQDWALRMRRQGIAVLFVHHQGKGGRQRGTSKREDVLDTVIGLARPPQYSPEDGAAFILSFDKARHIHGDKAAGFEARLETVDGRMVWSKRAEAESTLDRVVEMSRDGMSSGEIATELGCNRSTVYRSVRKAVEQGLLPQDAMPGKGAKHG